jgi:hypothetical protein
LWCSLQFPSLGKYLTAPTLASLAYYSDLILLLYHAESILSMVLLGRTFLTALLWKIEAAGGVPAASQHVMVVGRRTSVTRTLPRKASLHEPYINIFQDNAIFARQTCTDGRRKHLRPPPALVLTMDRSAMPGLQML